MSGKMPWNREVLWPYKCYQVLRHGTKCTRMLQKLKWMDNKIFARFQCLWNHDVAINRHVWYKAIKNEFKLMLYSYQISIVKFVPSLYCQAWTFLQLNISFVWYLIVYISCFVVYELQTKYCKSHNYQYFDKDTFWVWIINHINLTLMDVSLLHFWNSVIAINIRISYSSFGLNLWRQARYKSQH